MRVKNKCGVAVHYSFAGPGGGRTLGAGEVSVRLPARKFYDPDLQHALERNLVEVIFDEEDVGVVGVAGIPGPVAKVLSALQGGEAVRPPGLQPGPVTVSGPPAKPKPERKPRVEKPAADGSVRAGVLAKELKIPFHVLAAALEKGYGKRFYPLTHVAKDLADAMRERYAEKLEIPEVASAPVESRAEIRSISDLSASSEGLVSLADLMQQNRGGS